MTPVDSSYGSSEVRHRSRSVTRRRFDSKCNPRVSDCRSVDFGIPASLRRLAFTKLDTLPDGGTDERNCHSNPNTKQRLLGSVDWYCTDTSNGANYPRIGSFVARSLFFRPTYGVVWWINFFCCLILAVLTTTNSDGGVHFEKMRVEIFDFSTVLCLETSIFRKFTHRLFAVILFEAIHFTKGR